MSKKLFSIKYDTISTNYPSGRIFDNEKQHILYIDDLLTYMSCDEIKKQNEQLQRELDSFKPVMFQDMRKVTIILYSKGDTDE